MRIVGTENNDVLNGTSQSDDIQGLGGDDQIHGNDGDDFVQGNLGRDKVYGDAGIDTVRGGQGEDEVYGGPGDDEVHGDKDNDFVQGNEGRDRVFGDDGDDIVHGGQDDDEVDGGNGHDVIYGDLGSNTLTGGTGNDQFVIIKNPGQKDTITDFEYTNPSEKIDLSAFPEISNFSMLRITQEGADTHINLGNNQYLIIKNFIASNLQPGHFLGNAGLESINNDVLEGTAGDDYLRGGPGDDIIRGYAGKDYLQGNQGKDLLDGGDGDDVIRGGQDSDQVFGGLGDDKIYGDLGDDFVQGNQGKDIVDGGDGNDILHGGQDDDQVFGNQGDDVIYGDKGKDILTGGIGSDIFVMDVEAGAVDRITDFDITNPQELIDVSAFGNIKRFSDLKISQVNNNAQIDFGNEQFLILEGVDASQLKTRHFRAPWSAMRQVNIYNVGSRLGVMFERMPATIAVDFKYFVINDFTLSNPKNSDIQKPWNLIDLSRFSLSSIQLQEREGSTMIDLGQGRVLEIKNVKPEMLDVTKNFILSNASPQLWRQTLTSGWYANDDVSVVPVRVIDDEITHANGLVTYVAKATQLRLVNNNIGLAAPMMQVFKIDDTTPKVQVLNSYNVENPNQIIDISHYNITQFSALGIKVQGSDTIINIGDAKSIVLKNTNPNLLKPSNFIGFKKPIIRNNDYLEVFYPTPSEALEYIVENFDPNNPNHIVDLSDFESLTTLSDLKLQQMGADTVAELIHGKKLRFRNIQMMDLKSKHFFGRDNSITKKREAGTLSEDTFMSLPEALNSRGLSNVAESISDNLVPSLDLLDLLHKASIHSGGMNPLASGNFITSIATSKYTLLAADWAPPIVDSVKGYLKISAENPDLTTGEKAFATIFGVVGSEIATKATSTASVILASYSEPLVAPVIIVGTVAYNDKVVGPGAFELFSQQAISGIRAINKISGLTPYPYSGGSDFYVPDHFSNFKKISVLNQNGLLCDASYQENGEIQILAHQPNIIQSDNIAALLPDDFGREIKYLSSPSSAPIPVFKPAKPGNDDAHLTREYQYPQSTDVTSAGLNNLAQTLPDGGVGFYEGKYYLRQGSMLIEFSSAEVPHEVVYYDPEADNPPIIPVAESTPKITTILQDAETLIKNQITNLATALTTDIRSNPVLAALAADVIAGKNIDQAIQDFAKQFATSTTGMFGAQVIDKQLESLIDIGDFADGISGFSENLAVNIIGRLATGKLTLDEENLGREISLYAANYAVSEGVSAGVTYVLSAISVGFPIVGQIAVFLITNVIMKEFGDEVIEAWDKVADIAEGAWDFIGDPINGLEDLHDKLTDDKWTVRTGSDSADVMHSDSKWEKIDAKKGNDVMVGYNGWNIFFGGDGDDIMFGGDGTLTDNFLRPDEIYGGRGRDFIHGREHDDIVVGNSGKDFLLGGPGNDVMFGGDRKNSIFSPDPFEQDDPHNVVTLEDSDDFMHGNEGDDKMFGDKGNDFMRGGKGADLLLGGDGDDQLAGDDGPDHLDGGNGRDAIRYELSNEAVHVSLALQECSGGHAEGDTFINIEDIVGSSFNDYLHGDLNPNSISGGKGADTIKGGKGGDTLYGNEDDDFIQGELDDDILVDGLGSDTLSGGTGADLFVITPEASAKDTIIDFEVSNLNEKIDLTLFSNITNFADLPKQQVDSDTHIDLGNNQKLVIKNMLLSQLSEINFKFTSHSATFTPIVVNTPVNSPISPSEVESRTPTSSSNVVLPTSMANHPSQASTSTFMPNKISPSKLDTTSSISPSIEPAETPMQVSSANNLKPFGLFALPRQVLSAVKQSIPDLPPYFSTESPSENNFQSDDSFKDQFRSETHTEREFRSNDSFEYEFDNKIPVKTVEASINDHLAFARLAVHFLQRAYSWVKGTSSEQKETEKVEVQHVSYTDKLSSLKMLQKKLDKISHRFDKLQDNPAFEWVEFALEGNNNALSKLLRKSTATTAELSELELDIDHFYKEFTQEIKNYRFNCKDGIHNSEFNGGTISMNKFKLFDATVNSTREITPSTNILHLGSTVNDIRGITPSTNSECSGLTVRK